MPDVNEQFGLHIDEDTYTTIGGYVMGRIGRRAHVGEAIEVEGRIMRVVATRRLARLEGLVVDADEACSAVSRRRWTIVTLAEVVTRPPKSGCSRTLR